MNNLFKLLRDSRNGCWIMDYYAGVFGYADDLLLLCPSRSGLQNMLDIAEEYAKEHKISFSTDVNPTKSKTKGIIFSSKQQVTDPEPLILNGTPLPWVTSGKYLGNRMCNIQDGYQQDVREKRAGYIERNCELNQEFSFSHPEVKCNINRIYNSSFSGSCLWDLTGEKTRQMVNSWSVSVRHMWDLPLSTHRYLLEPLSGVHAETMIFSRYIKFVQSMRKSSKVAVQCLIQLVSKDTQTNTGRNIRYILNKTGESDIFAVNAQKLKCDYKFAPIQPEDQWKVGFIKELTNVKAGTLELNHDTIEDDDNDEAFTSDDIEAIGAESFLLSGNAVRLLENFCKKFDKLWSQDRRKG